MEETCEISKSSSGKHEEKTSRLSYTANANKKKTKLLTSFPEDASSIRVYLLTLTVSNMKGMSEWGI